MRSVREKWDLTNNAKVESRVLYGSRGAVTESPGAPTQITHTCSPFQPHLPHPSPLSQPLRQSREGADQHPPGRLTWSWGDRSSSRWPCRLRLCDGESDGTAGGVVRPGGRGGGELHVEGQCWSWQQGGEQPPELGSRSSPTDALEKGHPKEVRGDSWHCRENKGTQRESFCLVVMHRWRSKKSWWRGARTLLSPCGPESLEPGKTCS